VLLIGPAVLCPAFRYDWFALAETKIPTNVGVKFESYSDSEFKQTCDTYGSYTLYPGGVFILLAWTSLAKLRAFPSLCVPPRARRMSCVARGFLSSYFPPFLVFISARAQFAC